MFTVHIACPCADVLTSPPCTCQLAEAMKSAAEASAARSSAAEAAGVQQGEAAEGLRQELARVQRQVDQKETALQESRRLATAKEQVGA